MVTVFNMIAVPCFVYQVTPDDSLHVIQTIPPAGGRWPTWAETAQIGRAVKEPVIVGRSCNNCIDQHLKAVTKTIDNRHTCSTCTHLFPTK